MGDLWDWLAEFFDGGDVITFIAAVVAVLIAHRITAGERHAAREDARVARLDAKKAHEDSLKAHADSLKAQQDAATASQRAAQALEHSASAEAVAAQVQSRLLEIEERRISDEADKRLVAQFDFRLRQILRPKAQAFKYALEVTNTGQHDALEFTIHHIRSNSPADSTGHPWLGLPKGAFPIAKLEAGWTLPFEVTLSLGWPQPYSVTYSWRDGREGTQENVSFVTVELA